MDVIRAAYVTIEKESLLSNQFRLLVLTKYLFDVPRTARRDSTHIQVIGPYYSPLASGNALFPTDADEFSLRFPW